VGADGEVKPRSGRFSSRAFFRRQWGVARENKQHFKTGERAMLTGTKTRTMPIDDHKKTTLGIPYASPFRFEDGLDAIDLEAMRQGNAARGLRTITPAKIHVYA